MPISYYASFVVEDATCEDSRYVSGVIKLHCPLASPVPANDLKAILARGLNVDDEDIELLCWSALH